MTAEFPMKVYPIEVDTFVDEVPTEEPAFLVVVSSTGEKLLVSPFVYTGYDPFRM
jgi:hypothetical protein